MVKKILVVSLSNIGDVILTFPVMDVLKEKFPHSQISLVTSDKAKPLFKGSSYFQNIYIFDKHQSPWRQFCWVLDLRKKKFDLVVDLRNTAIPILIGAKVTTPLRRRRVPARHKRWEHLERLRDVVGFSCEAREKLCLIPNQQDETAIQNIIQNTIRPLANQKMVVVSPGAADRKKRWKGEGFARLCDRLIEEYAVKIVFVGDNKDSEDISRILNRMRNFSIDLSSETSLTQLAALIKKSALVIANDSAVMHMASYLDVPTVAFFGSTPSQLYGPWSSIQCVLSDSEDINHIEVDEALEKIRLLKILNRNKQA